MPARLVAGLLATALVARATVDINDRSVLMQTAVHMPAQQDMEAEAEMMFKDFEQVLASNEAQLQAFDHQAGMRAHVVDLVDRAELEAPQPVEAEEDDGAAFPSELEEMMDEVRKNPPRMPSAGKVLSLLKRNVRSMQNVSLETLDGIAKKTEEVADAMQGDSPLVGKIAEQLPLMFKMLNSKALFKSAKPAADALHSKDGSALKQLITNFQDLVGAPAQHMLNKFEGASSLGASTSKLFAAGGQKSSKPVCGGGPYIRMRVAPGVRFFPVAKTGYYLQANVGYEIGLQGPIPCFSQPVIELQLEKKEEAGRVLGVNLAAAFKPFGNEPLKFFLYRDFNLYLKEGSAVTPVDVSAITGLWNKYKKTALHQVIVGAGATLLAPWVEGAVKLEWLPKDTYEKTGGAELFAVASLGLKQEGFDYADYHATAACKLDDFLGGQFFNVDSLKLGYTLDEPGVSL